VIRVDRPRRIPWIAGRRCDRAVYNRLRAEGYNRLRSPTSCSPKYTYPASALMLRGSLGDLGPTTFRIPLRFSAEGAQFGAKPAIMGWERSETRGCGLNRPPIACLASAVARGHLQVIRSGWRPGRVAGQGGHMDGAATAATNGRSAVEGGHGGMHFPAGSGSVPSSGRIRGKGDERVRTVLQQVLSAAYPATGEVQATTAPTLTSAETAPAVAASALLIRDTDGTLCSAFARALLGRCSVNPRPVARTGFRHGRKARRNSAVAGGRPWPAPAIPRFGAG
jgi:hypothetical protein